MPHIMWQQIVEMNLHWHTSLLCFENDLHIAESGGFHTNIRQKKRLIDHSMVQLNMWCHCAGRMYNTIPYLQHVKFWQVNFNWISTKSLFSKRRRTVTVRYRKNSIITWHEFNLFRSVWNLALTSEGLPTRNPSNSRKMRSFYTQFRCAELLSNLSGLP